MAERRLADRLKRKRARAADPPPPEALPAEPQGTEPDGPEDTPADGSQGDIPAPAEASADQGAAPFGYGGWSVQLPDQAGSDGADASGTAPSHDTDTDPLKMFISGASVADAAFSPAPSVDAPPVEEPSREPQGRNMIADDTPPTAASTSAEADEAAAPRGRSTFRTERQPPRFGQGRAGPSDSAERRPLGERTMARAPRSRQFDDDRPLISPEEPHTPRWPQGSTDTVRRGSPEASSGSSPKKRRAQRVQGGGTVIIDDTVYSLLDWSTTGLAVSPQGRDYIVGETRTLELELDLADYAVNLDLKGRVVNQSVSRIGWQFVAPTAGQTQVLRSLALMALEGRGFKPTATVAGNATRVPKRRSRGWEVGRALRPLAAALSLPLNAAIIFVAIGLTVIALRHGADETSNRQSPQPPPAPTIRAEQAAVAINRITVFNEQTGQMLRWFADTLDPVDAGSVIAQVRTTGTDLERIDILSPCDCILARRLAEVGERVAVTVRLADLYLQGERTRVQAIFPSGTDLARGDPVAVRIINQREDYTGVIDSVGTPADTDGFIGLPQRTIDATDGQFVWISTETPIPATLAGEPAFVTLRTTR